jgi:antitoxin StbD
MTATTHHILTSRVASISALRENPSRVMEEAEGEAVAILNRNAPAFYCLKPELFEQMLEALEDVALAKVIESRSGEQARLYAEWDRDA